MTLDDRQEHLATRRLIRWAWVWVALAPLGAAFAVVVAALLYQAMGVTWDSDVAVPQRALVGIAAVVVGTTAPVLAIRYGVRASKRGSLAGTAAAAVGTLLLGVVLLWLVLGIFAT